MTTTEKMQMPKKRMMKLERLIKFWMIQTMMRQK